MTQEKKWQLLGIEHHGGTVRRFEPRTFRDYWIDLERQRTPEELQRIREQFMESMENLRAADFTETGRRPQPRPNIQVLKSRNKALNQFRYDLKTMILKDEQ